MTRVHEIDDDTATARGDRAPIPARRIFIALFVTLVFFDTIGDFVSATVDARICALRRIARAVVAILYLIIRHPHWHTWYGDSGLVPTANGRLVADPDLVAPLFDTSWLATYTKSDALRRDRS